MDFFDKLGKTITNTSKDVADKAKDLSNAAKLRMDIHMKEDYVEEQYASIGKAYYEAHQYDECPEYEQFELIKDALDEIAFMKAQLMDIRGVKQCPKCGASVADDAEYCSACGAHLTIYEEEEQ